MASRGFTLVELIVVVGVTVLLSAFLLTFGNSGRTQITSYVERAHLAEVIFRAKTQSLETYSNPRAPSLKTCGYGVHVDYADNQYFLFGIIDTDLLGRNCQTVSSIANAKSNPLLQYTEEPSHGLPPGIVFVPDPEGQSVTLDDVLFMPPQPKTLLWTSDGIGQRPKGTITLQGSDPITLLSNGSILF